MVQKMPMDPPYYFQSNPWRWIFGSFWTFCLVSEQCAPLPTPLCWQVTIDRISRDIFFCNARIRTQFICTHYLVHIPVTKDCSKAQIERTFWQYVCRCTDQWHQWPSICWGLSCVDVQCPADCVCADLGWCNERIRTNSINKKQWQKY